MGGAIGPQRRPRQPAECPNPHVITAPGPLAAARPQLPKCGAAVGHVIVRADLLALAVDDGFDVLEQAAGDIAAFVAANSLALQG